MIAECEVLMLVSLQSYTLLHFKRKQLLRWNVCQLSEDRNIRNIPSVTKGETHTNRLSFRLNKHKVSYFRLLRFYFRAARAAGETCLGGSPSLGTEQLLRHSGVGETVHQYRNCWNGDTNLAGFSRICYRTMESFRLEEPSAIIESNHSPSNAKATLSPHSF